MREYELEKRRFVIAGLIIVISVLYIVRLFNLQVADETFKKNADSNAFLRKTIYPSRGMIYDRMGRLIVFNQPAYDVMVIPKEIHDLDSLDLCSTLQITLPELRKKFEEMRDTRRNPGYSSFTQQVLIRHLSLEDYGRLQEKLYRFPGFFIQKKTLRKYNSTSGANILGNIREVNQNDIDNDSYYRAGDYTGDLGIEKSYETYLRGKKGQEILIRDAHGRIQGRFENGARDVAPVSGKDLTLSIDYNLQEYGEKLMQGKIGAIVEVNCETDFVAKTDGFKALVEKIAAHIVATKPADVEALLASELDGQTVEALVTASVAKIGEKISVRRFALYEAPEGVVAAYIHGGGKIGVVVELKGGNAELGKDVAMHVAAANPSYLERSQVPAAELEHEKEVLSEQAKNEGKPEKIIEKMVMGRINKYYKEVCLVDQEFVKDPDQTVGKLVKAAGAEVLAFSRFQLGEGIEKKQEDFAAEVMSQIK